ncbi:MAG TPA: 30S ribosomal protein S6 [Longimicrobiaceae bacterium]|jgi:small subunit ribosomal protein S6|nr:30S ribosomal protein S6 [Longimicrobiaceae bacterium]
MSKGKVTLRDYEIVYIFSPAVEDERINEKVERYHALLTGTNGGEITAVDHWGKRQLAYSVEDQTTGYYVVAQFAAPAEALPEFERLLKLDEELLRYLVVVNEGDLKTTPVQATPARDEDEDSDED